MLGGAAHRRILQLGVDAACVVVVDVFSEKSLKVVLVQDDHVIEQFSACAPDPSLRDSVLPRASECRSLRLNSEMFDRLSDPFLKYGIVIVDEAPWRGVIRERLAELLHEPGRCRMRGDAEVDDLSSSVTDDEPGMQ